MSKKSDHFPLRVSRGIATSDEYAELTDRERSVFWTAAALSFEPLTFKRLARTMNSKIVDVVGRLVDQGFLEIEAEEIRLAARWAKVDMSTDRVNACRERKRAAKASTTIAAPIPQPAPDLAVAAPQIASQPSSVPQAQSAPIKIPESRIPTFPPAENFEDAMPYTDDWDDSDFGIDLGGLAATSAFDLAPVDPAPIEAAPVVAEQAPALVEPTAVAVPTKAARKREKAMSEADQVANIELPPFIPRELYLGFVESRIRMGKPLTLLAAKLFIGECTRAHEDKHDVAALITKAVIGGWQSIFIPERRSGYADKATAQQAERKRTGGVAL
ncbi:hypothetical protein [Massilia sp. NP310]|uniref:hypothetical protein n=1 Tax=Massilia sp. NP310 TaxID=2861282 RepID=UPI001C62CDB9|nr:hypothetical protein [Massilia sp. NP310]QYG04023.1 hypothetical protein KY496_11895 [Massilia sp. NP310]